MNQSSATPPWLAPFPRTYVDADLVVRTIDDIEPLYSALQERAVDSLDDLTRWLADWSEVSSVVDQLGSRAYIEMTCHTDSDEKKEAYLTIVRVVTPKVTEWEDRLNKKYMASPARRELDQNIFGQLDRTVATEVELFVEKNIPVQVKLAELSQKYQGITGGMTVQFEGEERTMPQMAVFLRETDRGRREAAYLASTARRLEEKNRLENIFDEMVALRTEYAANLGLSDYRDYAFRSKMRDYTPADCETFHAAIEKTAVPLARKINERRRQEMGLDALKPWDTACDSKGRSPLKPFVDADQLKEGVGKVFGTIDPKLGHMFDSIGFSMDLTSRKGKAPGGYQATLAEDRIPFIFTNAVGLQDDVNTLLHEGGHSFHTLQSRTQPYQTYRHAPMEFSEVASMSMELLGLPGLGVFYEDRAHIDRAVQERLESVVSIFPWVAQVDAFQNWIYTSPDNDRTSRAAKWLELSDRFNTGVDWEGISTEARAHQWHRQLHIFEVPFYYIEYAIAQMGALQIWRNYKSDKVLAVQKYLSALSLGGSRKTGELFDVAGIRFDFSKNLLGELMEMVEEALNL